MWFYVSSLFPFENLDLKQIGLKPNYIDYTIGMDGCLWFNGSLVDVHSDFFSFQYIYIYYYWFEMVSFHMPQLFTGIISGRHKGQEDSHWGYLK